MVVIGRKTTYTVLSVVIVLGIIIFVSAIGYLIPIKGEKFEATGKVIVIDPGHGGEDPGAKSSDGLQEKHVNLAIALKLKKLIDASGNKCVLTRNSDELHYSDGTKAMRAKRREDIEYRKNVVKSCNADIFVSIHLNSFTQTQYRGVQTFYPRNFPESKKLAEIIQKELIETVDRNNKRVSLVRNDIMIFENISIPTVLVECGFLSNSSDVKALKKDEHLEKIARAIFIGCIKYLSGISQQTQ